jgi:hypothetical protein
VTFEQKFAVVVGAIVCFGWMVYQAIAWILKKNESEKRRILDDFERDMREAEDRWMAEAEGCDRDRWNEHTPDGKDW